MMSNIPDCISRIAACRLVDGRFYLVINAFPSLGCNRQHLMLLCLDDGLRFSKAYLLVNDLTATGLFGIVKNHGYRYPFCMPARQRLLVSFSIDEGSHRVRSH